MAETSTESTRPQGRLAQALVALFMKRATVAALENLGAGFRMITLESPQFRSFAWSAGQKLQISIGGGFTNRTYTPIDWDEVEGRTRIIGYAHGAGPGSDWLRNVRPGHVCDVFGPRASLQLARVGRPMVVFGDETSLGLAIAAGAGGSVQVMLEADSAEAVRGLLGRFGPHGAQVFGRQPDDAHLMAIEDRLADPVRQGASFVLTGKATSIQRLRRLLKVWNVPSSAVSSKAYWAPGKTGLD